MYDDIFEDFENMLKRHDWYYQMSDDHRVYTAGATAAQELQAAYRVCKQFDEERAVALYEKYVQRNY